MGEGNEGQKLGRRSPESGGQTEDETVAATQDGMVVNASGYKDQLKRQYGLVGLAGIALTVDNAWIALGSSISVSIANGGPPGVIFGLIVAAFYYSFIGLGLAEFSSSVPTAGGVYHWATIAAGPRWGRMLGFFTGWINFYGWMFDLASLIQITANISVNLYVVYHQSTYVYAAWQVYVAYILITWICVLIVVFANRVVPHTQTLGMFFVIAGGLVSIIVVAALPSKHASNEFVWGSFVENNVTGWPGGVAFLCGVLNGAFTIGTPDAITHMAEELPHPKRDLPRAIALQIGLGFLYAFVFAIAIMYAVTDLSALTAGVNTYPLANIYQQAATRSDGTQNLGAQFGLLFIIWCSSMLCCIGTTVTNSRIYWALARDNAVPFSGFFSKVSERLSCPVPATLFVAVIATGLGAIPIGSSTAFLDLTGSFIILTTVSYAIPFIGNVMTRRQNFPPGPFHLGKWGDAVNIIAVVLIMFFNIFYCFPYALPTTAESMNYNSVILVGVMFITAAWWFIHARTNYPGPKVMTMYIHEGQVVETPLEAGGLNTAKEK
ncbi:amino acid transporter [Cryphonectria parasitica EP155]|uniref:Amino acid transporter n=1 Tax=Cryphonectria parasitica (strain ATCC 38755 / EP155) TaxID=660469 RepID=A0A9P4XWS3_CRYP1|nr:amino acid transporter [Cryphonectria parasitica EP155]KAF3762237.1 amino acid transporter [Cryphonectria parasitica EP155]